MRKASFFNTMLNRKKIIGIMICVIGVALARIDSFFEVTPQVLFSCKAAGILIAFLGLAAFCSGLTRVTKRVRACPACYAKNALDAVSCVKCKKALP